MSDFLINVSESSNDTIIQSQEEIEIEEPEEIQSCSLQSNKSTYTLEFKLKAIQFLDSLNDKKYTAAKRSKNELGRYVCRQNFYLWKKQEAMLKELKDNRSLSIKRKRRIRSDIGSHNAKFPEIDQKTLEKIREHRKMGLAVSDEDIFKFGIEARDELNKDRDDNNKIVFSSSNGWRYRFKQRYEIVKRNATTIGQKIPQNAKELAISFFNYIDKWIIETREQKNRQLVIANMDEMPLYFDTVSNLTYEFKNTDSVKLKTTGKEKLRFTLVLCALSDGRKCLPMIIFKNLKKPPKPPKGIVWPNDVIISAVKGGSMNEELMFKWMSSVWKSRPNGFFANFALTSLNTLLIFDSARAHTTAKVKTNLRKYYGTEVCVVPGGMTPLIQPLDVGINYSVKRKFAALWKDWMAESEKQFKETNIKSKVTYGLIVEWVSQVWREIDSTLIKTAFTVSGITLNGVRNENDYNHKLLEIFTTGVTEEIEEHSGLTDNSESEDENDNEESNIDI